MGVGVGELDKKYGNGTVKVAHSLKAQKLIWCHEVWGPKLQIKVKVWQVEERLLQMDVLIKIEVQVRLCVCVCTDLFSKDWPLQHSLFCMSKSVIKPKSFWGRSPVRTTYILQLQQSLCPLSCSASLTPASLEWSASTRPRASAVTLVPWATPACQWRVWEFCMLRPTNRWDWRGGGGQNESRINNRL